MTIQYRIIETTNNVTLEYIDILKVKHIILVSVQFPLHKYTNVLHNHY